MVYSGYTIDEFFVLMLLLWVVEFVIILCAILTFVVTPLWRIIVTSLFYGSTLWVISLALLLIIVNTTVQVDFLGQMCR